jgi:hypothetical protein
MTKPPTVILSAAKNLKLEVVQQTQLSHLGAYGQSPVGVINTAFQRSHPDAPAIGCVNAGGVGEVGVVGPERGVGIESFVGDGDGA